MMLMQFINQLKIRDLGVKHIFKMMNKLHLAIKHLPYAALTIPLGVQSSQMLLETPITLNLTRNESPGKGILQSKSGCNHQPRMYVISIWVLGKVRDY